MRKSYLIVKNLTDQSGWGWDNERKLVTAPPNVWDTYLVVCSFLDRGNCMLKCSQTAKKWRNTPFVHHYEFNTPRPTNATSQVSWWSHHSAAPLVRGGPRPPTLSHPRAMVRRTPQPFGRPGSRREPLPPPFDDANCWPLKQPYVCFILPFPWQ